MRRIHFLIATIVATGVGGLAGACGSDDTNAGTTDGGSNDAASDGTTIDAGDAGKRDAASDAGPSLVTITAAGFPEARSAGYPLNPIAGANVVFYDPSGTPMAPITTGADGKASAVVADGSSVTIAIPDSPGFDLTTFIGVQGGDDLIAYSQGGTFPPQTGSVDLSYPAGDGGSPGTAYSVGCGYTGGSPGATMPIGPECVSGGHVNALAYSVDPVTAYASDPNVALIDGGASIGGWTWSGATSTPVTLTGSPPAGTWSFSANLFLRGGPYTYAWYLGGNQSIPDGGTITPISIGLPGSPITFLDNLVLTTGAVLAPDSTGEVPVLSILTVDTLPTSTLTADLTQLPPRLHDPVMTFDSGARTLTVSWQSDASSAALVGDTTTIYLETSNDAGPFQDSWTVVSPHGTSVTTPALTPAQAAYFPGAGGTLSFGAVTAQGGSLLSNYSVFRAHYGDYVAPYQAPIQHGTVVTSLLTAP